jgi:hypothetical protein
MNVRIAQAYQPMTEKEQEIMINKVKYYARELAYYKF